VCEYANKKRDIKKRKKRKIDRRFVFTHSKYFVHFLISVVRALLTDVQINIREERSGINYAKSDYNTGIVSFLMEFLNLTETYNLFEHTHEHAHT
jgi:hypothetical protein